MINWFFKKRKTYNFSDHAESALAKKITKISEDCFKMLSEDVNLIASLVVDDNKKVALSKLIDESIESSSKAVALKTCIELDNFFKKITDEQVSGEIHSDKESENPEPVGTNG